VLIKYLYRGSPLTSPKDASAAIFAVTFSNATGYWLYALSHKVYEIPFGRRAILKETLPAPAKGVRY
jgi:hypothetical protein